MRAVISNVFSDNNKGGSLLTQAAIRFVQAMDPAADISLLLVDPDPHGKSMRHTLAGEDCTIDQPPLVDITRRLGGASAFFVSLVYLALGKAAGRWFHRVRRLSQADVVVSKGGHVFVERRGIRGVLGLWVTAFPLLYGRRCGALTIISGATIGPFPNRASRIANKAVLRWAHVVLPRDHDSARDALDLGVPRSRVHQVPDGVFAFSPGVSGERERAVRARCRVSVDHRFAIVTTGHAAGDEDVFVTAVAFCMRELAQDRLIDEVLVPLHVLSPEGRSGDRALSERLVKELQPLPARILDEDLSPHDLIALYAGAVLVTGRRLHSTLFGLLAATPSLPIVHPSTPAKAKRVYDTIGLGSWVVDVRQPHEMLDAMRSLARDREEASKAALKTAQIQHLQWQRAVEQLVKGFHIV